MVVTFALPKGALLKDSIQLLQRIGFDFSAFLDSSNRQLQITDPTGRAQALLVRSQDVPIYVSFGQAQFGIVGEDVLQEKPAAVAKLVDLKFGRCHMAIAVMKDSPYRSVMDLPPHCRVASKFVRSATRYFRELDLPVELVPLYGSVELAPITGMAEAIVDLVSTGRTLRDNGLIEIEFLYESTARLIAHPLSWRLHDKAVQDVVSQVRSHLEQGT
ncbi:MAG: ATP phosphoribosyltransferase [Oscillatoriales cyanobacterium SM2_2_1]|nr:ATP phosphoribosyltransferase [Oscillatoriales cyanobacterium SM2_2_1]